MIILQRIQLEHFMSVEELELTFEQQEILTIIGDNGAGKSALLYALALALIEYRKGDSYRDFIQKGQDKAKVYVEALYKGNPITFDITISNGKYSIPLQRKIQYNGTLYTNSECTMLLKQLEVEYLQHTMFLFQRDNSIVDLKPGERSKMLKKLFHFEFDAQVEHLKQLIENKSQLYKELQVRLEETTKVSYEEDLLLDTLDSDVLSNIEQQRKDIQQKLSQSSMFDVEEIGKIDTSLKTAAGQYDEAVNDLQKLKDDKSREEGFYKVAEAELNHLLSQETNTQQVELDIESLESDVEKASENYVQLSYDQKSLIQKVEEKQEHLHIYKQGVCFACGSVLDDQQKVVELGDEIKQLEEKVSLLSESLKEALNTKQRLSELKDKQKQALLAARKLKAQISQTTLTRDSALHAVENLNLQIGYAEQTVARLEKEIAELSTKAEEVSFLREMREEKLKHQAELKEIEDTIQLHNQHKAINTERERKNEQIKQLRREQEDTVKQLTREMTASSSDIDIARQALKIFETEFPNFVILQACSQMETYMNAFIQRVFPYMSVKLQQSRSGVEFFYTPNSSEEDSWVSVKMASGAQSSILSLAWRIAIARIYGITTLLLDEVDESSTDENSRLIYEFIASLTFFNQIILISHKKEAVRAISAMADNVRGFEVEQGVYTEINPENVE